MNNFPKLNTTHVWPLTRARVSLLRVCFHSNQAADLSDPLSCLKVPVLISEIICCVFGSEWKPAPENSAAESCCVLIPVV